MKQMQIFHFDLMGGEHYKYLAIVHDEQVAHYFLLVFVLNREVMGLLR